LIFQTRNTVIRLSLLAIYSAACLKMLVNLFPLCRNNSLSQGRHFVSSVLTSELFQSVYTIIIFILLKILVLGQIVMY